MYVRALRSANRRQPAVVLAIAALIVLTLTACGQSAAGSYPRARTGDALGTQDGPHPAVVSSQGPSPDATLPRVSASGATVRALWQLPLIYPEIVGDTVVGLAGDESSRIEAVSALTGQLRWSAPPPAQPQVLGVSVEGPVVIVEAGGSLHDPARQIVVKEIAVYSLADGARRATSVRTWRGRSCSPNRVEDSSLAGRRREGSSGARADRGRVRRVTVTKPAATRAWPRTAACWSPPTRAYGAEHMCLSSGSRRAAAGRCGNGERSRSGRETRPRSSTCRSSVWPRRARSCCCRGR